MNLPENISFLRGRGVLAINLLLIVQAGGFYAFSQKEKAPAVPALALLPSQIGEWETIQQSELDAETMGILHPDDHVIRMYRNAAGSFASLFIAYFRTQQTGHAPHSPQNCLPGNGWAIQNREVVPIAIPETGDTISVNRYVISKEEDKAVVLYWYHGPSRVIANEYYARAQLIVDSIRYHRSDTALVRVMVPFTDQNEAAAERTATTFAQQLHPRLERHIPLI